MQFDLSALTDEELDELRHTIDLERDARTEFQRRAYVASLMVGKSRGWKSWR